MSVCVCIYIHTYTWAAHTHTRSTSYTDAERCGYMIYDICVFVWICMCMHGHASGVNPSDVDQRIPEGVDRAG